MNEEESKKQEGAAPDKDEGNKPKGYELVKQANAASERLEKAIDKFREENERLEENIAQARLGGGIEGGQPQKKKELTPKEYIKELMERGYPQ